MNLTKEIQELEEKLNALKAAALKPSMVFTPKADESFDYVEFSVTGEGWGSFAIERCSSDPGDYSIPALRKNYAKGEAEVLNAVYKARACKGVVLSPYLVEDRSYYYIHRDGQPGVLIHCKSLTWLEMHLFPIFETEEDCQACIDMLGGSDAVKRLMRLWHGEVA